MKAFLMHAGSDFDLTAELPGQEPVLTKDLELETLLRAMAAGDELIFEVAKRALLLGLDDPEAIVYRQRVLRECLEHPEVVRALYEVAGEALRAEKAIWGSLLRDSPRNLLSTSVQKMEAFVDFLRALRRMADEHAEKFDSSGFTRFFAMLRDELDEPYFELIESHLKALKFGRGMLLSARLTAGNKGTGYTLRQPREQSLLGRVFDRSGYSFTIPDRDENGFRAVSALEERGVNLVANATAQAVDHVHSFFVMLRVEIGFYVGCLNLAERLAEVGEPTAFPVPVAEGELALSARGLYDVCLRLTTPDAVVGNDVEADDKSLVMITGANQGGKSTFLRSVGLAQLMTQAGMFVGADSLRVNICDGVFTHYKREEDKTMESGKLDEELARMSQIADRIAPNCLLLCNESFASTNEREGSEIARQVVNALLEAGVKVMFVTHMFDLANSFHQQGLETALFLRAERGADGARPFKIAEGEPRPTSYGEDSYRKIFGKEIKGTPAPMAGSGRRRQAPPTI
jgi:DNA mismatch repair ATPase MutS